MPTPRISALIEALQNSRDIVGSVPIVTNTQLDQSTNDLISVAMVTDVLEDGSIIVELNGSITVKPVTDEVYKVGDAAYVTVVGGVQIAHGVVK